MLFQDSTLFARSSDHQNANVLIAAVDRYKAGTLRTQTPDNLTVSNRALRSVRHEWLFAGQAAYDGTVWILQGETEFIELAEIKIVQDCQSVVLLV